MGNTLYPTAVLQGGILGEPPLISDIHYFHQKLAGWKKERGKLEQI